MFIVFSLFDSFVLFSEKIFKVFIFIVLITLFMLVLNPPSRRREDHGALDIPVFPSGNSSHLAGGPCPFPPSGVMPDQSITPCIHYFPYLISPSGAFFMACSPVPLTRE